MALTATLSVSQADDKSEVIISDLSNYSSTDVKGNFTSRNLILYKSDGTVFRGEGQISDTINFSFAGYPSDSITISGVDRDYALTAVMTLAPIVVVSGSIYTATTKFALTGYVREARFTRCKKQAVQPRLEMNPQYLNDTYRLRLEQDLAIEAAAQGDVTSAQLALDRAAKIIANNPVPY
jgi:hypothetical protein